MDAIYEEHRSDWSHQVSAVETTRWLQRDQTLPLSAKGVACETTLMLLLIVRTKFSDFSDQRHYR